MQTLPPSAADVPGLAALAARCDHIDVKTYRSRGRLDAFIAGFMAYHPAWIRALYAVRWGFVRLLGMKQERLPDMGVRRRPEDVPMQPGQKAAIFVVEQAEPERYWLVSASDRHLTAYLCITVEAAGAAERRFDVITLVEYNNWAGPVYFNVIRPFHHLVVGRMALAGVQAAGGPVA